MDAVKHEKPQLRRSLSATSAGLQDGAPQSSSRKERVWVGVRIRPLLEQELLDREQTAWKAVQDTTLQYLDPEHSAAQQSASYQYNRVFPETSTSEQVYADAASNLIAAAVNGYNGTVFAYGQTGSGKTYTMQAIMASGAKHLFGLIAQDASREFIIRMSALEIYNENVRDLLQEKSPSVKLMDDAKGTVADGLSETGVASEPQLQQLLNEVAARRQTRATRMNDNSSRSHAIVRLYIESRPLSNTAADASSTQDLQQAGSAAVPKHRSSLAVTTAAINFVDLAGSERAANSADTGEAEKLRAKEAGNIHKSLLTLSCVIRGLADHQKHLPYRDSKLTRLLQPYLSGNSHMAIITTISPAAGSADNTRAALHFATAAARVVMRPQLNRVASSKAVIKAMASEIQQLKAKLVRLESEQAAMKQVEAEAATAGQERDTLRTKLKALQDQILRGDQATVRQAAMQRLRGSLPADSQVSGWQNRVALAKELRASSAGILTGRITNDSAAARDCSQFRVRPSTSGGGSSCSTFAPLPELRASSSELMVGMPDVRRSMRLLNCYLPRNAAADSPTQQQPQQQQQQLPRQQQQPQPRQQSGWQSILQHAAQKKQQQQHPQGTSRLQQQGPQQPQAQPEEVVRALQMQKLQEPSGPEAEAAMAGLEVEVRCYKHVQEYTLAELSAALEHLESQAASGQGTCSWSSDQLDALRSEVARKRAAEALTQLGDKALDALTRKVNSYTSSADTSPFVDLKRQLRVASSRDASLVEAALTSSTAVRAASQAGGGEVPGSRRVSSPETVLSQDGDPGSWPDMAPRCLSGRTTPTFRVPGGRGSILSGVVPAATPSTGGQLVQQQAAGLTPEASSSSSAAGSGPAGPSSYSSSTAASRRQSATGVDAVPVPPAAAAVSPPGAAAAVVVAQEQLLRMQEAWRESVEKDVICLREVLGQYKERLERLEMQKQLLLSQVLKLEFSLEEEETKVDQLQAQLQQTLRERDTARAAAASAVNMAAAAAGGPGSAAGAIAAASNAGCEGAEPSGAPTTPQGPGTLHVALPPINTAAAAGIFDACSDDGWASTPTVDSLLPKIVALWDELYVPLVYRSRFFLCFRGREVFYYEVEARRLEWKRSQMLQGAIDEPSMQLGRGSFGLDGNNTPTARGPTGPNGTPRPLSAAAAAGLTASSSSFGGMRRRSKELDKAARALDWERKSLAAGLKWNLTEPEREELYRSWGVDADTKERKLQLVFKLWSKETLSQPDGMQRSSELVVMLCGMDASEHMMELVFGSHTREYSSAAGPASGRASSSGLSYALSNFARRLAPPLSRAGAIGSSPLRSSMTSIGPSGLGGGYGGHGAYAPSRAGGSFTSKIMHSGFMSLLGSRDRSNLSSHHLVGMGGSMGPASREGSFSSLASSVMPGRKH